jgi:dimethylamine/trimethylamine dehydrogenase
LECAHALAKRGYEVVIAEKENQAGGRVLQESAMPGLSEWKRIIDYRLNALKQMPNVEMYFDNEVTPENLLEFGFENIIIATGSKWKSNGQSRLGRNTLETDGTINSLSPDDIMAGNLPKGEVLIYDLDHYYMASVIAEKCQQAGCQVAYLSNESKVSAWTDNTLEQLRIHQRLLKCNIQIILNQEMTKIQHNQVVTQDVYSRKENRTSYDAVVLVTERQPNDELFMSLKNQHSFKHFTLIGDAYAPGLIAQAIHAGHLEAQTFGDANADKNVFKRDKGYNPP